MLGRRFGLIGIPLASLLAQLAACSFRCLLPALADRTGLALSGLARDVLRPWAVVSLPDDARCAVSAHSGCRCGSPGAVVAGVVVGLASTLGSLARLILGYSPVAALIRGRLAALRLDGLLALAGLEGTGPR